jgi:hypothetical protein
MILVRDFVGIKPAHLSQISLNRLRIRRLKFLRERFFPAATAQVIKQPARDRKQSDKSDSWKVNWVNLSQTLFA